MKIPLLKFSNFIKIINKEKNIKEDFKYSKSKNNPYYVELKLFNFKILKLIEKLIPDYDIKNEYNLLLWARIAFHLRVKQNIDIEGFENEFYSWKENQGNSYTHLFNKESGKYIKIEEFISRSITQRTSKEFNMEWICATNPPIKNKKDPYQIYGGGSIKNAISCLDEAINNKTIDFLEKSKVNKGKKYICYASRDKLYNELKLKHNLTTKLSTFKGVASTLIISKYKGR